jgi:hypothetical protein
MILLLRVPRAAYLFLSSIVSFRGISVPPITIPELVIKKPSRDPVGAAVVVFDREAPVIAGMGITRFSDASHSFIFGSFLNIAPVVRGLPLAVVFQMALVGR